MNKTEIQSRIEKCESELASLKADLAKCDCAEGIEQERCWHSVTSDGGVCSVYARTMQQAINFSEGARPAYMPECRQVTADDVRNIWDDYTAGVTISHDEFAKRSHKLGFRMKVTP